jgi:hypothetical protein
MTRTFVAAVISGALGCALPAQAQTVGARPAAQTPTVGWLSIGATAGAGAVQKVGGVFGGEIGIRVTDQFEVLAEGTWMQNVVTRRRLDVAATVASFLQSSQGGTASSTIEAPAFYTGGGFRFVLTKQGRVRPYVTAGAGVARVSLQPKFTLAGSDVTANLTQYGITLGSDLTGDVTKAAFTGGVGVRMLQGRWYIDGDFRVTNIQTEGQATRVIRAGAGFGLRF